MDETQFTAEAQRAQRKRRGYRSSSNTLCVSSALSAPAAVNCLSILNILVLLDFNLHRPHLMLSRELSYFDFCLKTLTITNGNCR
jgi:hypothetical protein